MNVEGLLTNNGALTEQLALNNGIQRQLTVLAIGTGGPLGANANALTQEVSRSAEVSVLYNREDASKIDVLCQFQADPDNPVTIKEIGIFDDMGFLHVIANVESTDLNFRVTFTPFNIDAILAEEDNSVEEVTKAFVLAEIDGHNEDANAHSGISQAINTVQVQVNALATKANSNEIRNNLQDNSLTDITNRLNTVESQSATSAEDIDALEIQKGLLRNGLDALSDTVGQNAETLANNTTQMAEHSAKLGQTETQLNGLVDAVSDLQWVDAGHVEQLANLDARISTNTNQGNGRDQILQRHGNRLQALETVSTTQTERIDSLAASDERLQMSLGELDAQVNQNTQKNAQHAVSIDSHRTRLDEVEDKAGANESAVSALAQVDSGLQRTLDLHADAIANSHAKNAQQDEALGQVAQRLDTLDNTDQGVAVAIAGLTDNNMTLQTALESAKESIASNTVRTVQLETATTHHNQRLGELESLSNEQASDLANLQSTDSELTQRLDNVEANAQSSANANANAIGELSTRVDEVVASVTVSSGSPSGGKNGDIWYKV